ncbi:MAG: hypothetical protein HOW73_35220 [Polyangiaceae bacterium]|nr:hypothetical protein [Polyangiaceae bacterium]
MRTLISVSTAAHPNVVDALRELSEAVSNAQFSPAVAQRVGLTTHELVDNAIRFGSLRSDIEYQLAYDLETGVVVVRVANTALPSRIALLNAHLERLRRLQASGHGLSDLIRSAAMGKVQAQLGLARVRHEASMEVRIEVEDDRLVVIASGRT